MGRPLTVADRAPRSGDVLQKRNGTRVYVFQVFPVGSYLFGKRVETTRIAEYFGGCPTTALVDSWRYVSRADNGPITIDG